MTRKSALGLLVLVLMAFSFTAVAQESAVKGNLAGTVYDSTGAVVPGAKVTVTGPTGIKSVESDNEGRFVLPLLVPGFYSLKVEKQGFKISDVKAVEVATNKTTSVRVNLEPGAVSETVEVTAAAVTVDTASTAVGANLTDTFYQQIPAQRGVAGLFYASPGVAGGGLTGSANPSISGGSGLENQYVADGVNITDGAFGGLGVFSRVYGSLATGINLSFVKEVQVKTGGYEPQYGKSTGGIVQIVTKTGSRDFHGAVTGFFQPQQFEAGRILADDYPRFNLQGKVLHDGAFDVSGEVGGYVPGFRDKVFFFGSFNPSWTRQYAEFSQFHGIVPTPGAAILGATTLMTTAYNYAAKGTVRLSDSHTVEASIFGDPSRTPSQANGGLNTFSATTHDRLAFGTRSIVGRYNGTLTPTWLLNASLSWGHNYLSDVVDNPEHYGIVNNTTRDPIPADCPGAVPCAVTGNYLLQGFGFHENTEGGTIGFNLDTSKTFNFGGEHTFSVGYRLEKSSYDGRRARSGPDYTIPATNAFGDSAADIYGALNAPVVAGQVGDSAGQLRVRGGCTACPLMNIPGLGLRHVSYYATRGEFGDRNFDTDGTYHTLFVNDSWSPWKYLTINLGLRWEQQQMQGSNSAYTYTGNWSPRIGVAVDPWGDRKTKIYTNFGRYNYAVPLDMAIRSLSNESDLIAMSWAPRFTNDDLGPCADPCTETVLFGPTGELLPPLLDVNHFMSSTTSAGGVAITPTVSLSAVSIAPGTKMQYLDEWVVGFEREFGAGVIFSARYVDRRLKRIVEDLAGLSPEASNAGIPQNYFISNPAPATDLFINPIQIPYDPAGAVPAACIGQELDPVTGLLGPASFTTAVVDSAGNSLASPAGSTNTSVCVLPTFDSLGNPNYVGGLSPGGLGSDGIPDGFVQPVRNYQAMEFEVNKSFSRNWQLRANWRISRLKGNYEGAFRNDNGQSDPSISSLFDFVAGEFNQLGDQFAQGYLNTDRRHVVNAFFSYVFDKTALKGLTLGTGVRVESGIPINDLRAHPVYQNAGEIPTNGRGSLGRLPTNGTVDVHADYVFNLTEKTRLRFGADLFNLANMKRQIRIDQNEDRAFGVPNADFRHAVGAGTSVSPAGYQRPFYARLMVKFEF